MPKEPDKKPDNPLLPTLFGYLGKTIVRGIKADFFEADEPETVEGLKAEIDIARILARVPEADRGRIVERLYQAKRRADSKAGDIVQGGA